MNANLIRQKAGTKEFKLRLPLPLWESFYRLFPNHGERTLILRQLVAKLVEKAEEKDGFLEEIIEKLGGE